MQIQINQQVSDDNLRIIDSQIKEDFLNSRDQIRIEQQQKKDVNKYFRFIKYPICNKNYQIVSLYEQQNRQQMDIDLDFREPNRFLGVKRNRKKHSSKYSIFSYIRQLYQFAKSVQISSFLPYRFKKQTLQSKYKYVSLAILNNSIKIDAAVIKALQYNIPLMQMIINHENILQQINVKQKILKCFNISHFINQNFVLYGDWEYEYYRQFFDYNDDESYNQQWKIFNKNNNSGKIVFRKGRYVFAEISLECLDKINSNDLEQKFIQIRDHYYIMEKDQSVFKQQNMNNQSKLLQKYDNDEVNEKSQDSQSNRLNSIQQQLLEDYLSQKVSNLQNLLDNSDEDNSQQNQNSSYYQKQINNYQLEYMNSKSQMKINQKSQQNNFNDFTVRGYYQVQQRQSQQKKEQQSDQQV